MRTSEAAKYARWAATTAIVLALVAAGVYAWRRWQAAQSRKDAPAPVPASVNRQSETFSFSKVEGQRTLFTVRASQVTELREGGKSLLEDVWITIYGRSGKRFDNIHASQCDYLPADGRITCAGDVQIDLESAEEAKESPGRRAIRIRTSNVWFLRETGEARTDQPVEFQFEFGHGRAVGVSYSTESAVVRLEREVQMMLTSTGQQQAVREPLSLTAAALEYRRAASTMRLLGPVRASQGLRELTAEAMALEFDAAMRARRLLANGSAKGPTGGLNGGARPRLQWAEADGSQRQLVADEFVAQFAVDGRVERVTAQGSVDGTARYGARQDRLAAQQAVVEMDARNEPRTLLARGGVRVESQQGSRVQRLETEALQLEFASQAGQRAVARGQTLAAALVELHDGAETTQLRAARLATDFAARYRLRRLLGSGGVEIVRRLERGPEQKTASQQFAVEFGAGGQWTRAEQSGKVRFREGERIAEAERAQMVRATELLTLEGSATVGDALSRTTAAKIEINQRSGEAAATGSVRTSYLQGAAADGKDNTQGPNFAREPAHISADQLRIGGAGSPGANASQALYTGRARLWQGDAVIEAEQMELDRATQRLEARGKVRGVFPEAALGAEKSASLRVENAKSEDQHGGHGGAERTQKAENRSVVRFTAGKLTYLAAEGRARLQEAVTVESAAARIAAREMVLAFAEAGRTQRVTSAEGTGGCTVRQGTRRGAAQQCTYDAAEGKFVLSGGEPSLADPLLGVTTGRQLTFFLADDKILVESAAGTRTVTRHRVEK